MLSFIDFEASFVMLFNDKVGKNAPKMKSSDRFRTVFDSAVICQPFQAPYTQSFGHTQRKKQSPARIEN